MINNKILAKETIDVLEKGYTTEKLIHKGYTEFENAKKKYGENFLKFKLNPVFGKWQYIFKKGNLKISLGKFNSNLFGEKDKWFWEIYAFDDKRLFTGCRRFTTIKKAMKDVESWLSKLN